MANANKFYRQAVIKDWTMTTVVKDVQHIWLYSVNTQYSALNALCIAISQMQISHRWSAMHRSAMITAQSIQGESQKTIPSTFVDILAVRVNLWMQFYTTVKQ